MTEKQSQILTLTDRRELKVNGVLEVVYYDDREITLYTALGDMYIRGNGLEVSDVFSESGAVNINGYVNSVFFGDSKSRYAENFISRIFR